jgi:dihydrolipoamide dehydrogenase
MIRTQIAIVGTGPGGYVAALRAAQLGAEVVCIEKENLGGVCLNWGCIPTKALLRTAEVYDLVRRAAEFGIILDDEPRLDWTVATERMDQAKTRLIRGVRTLLNQAGVEVVQGQASLARANTLRVTSSEGEETIVADDILLATGSRHLDVPIPGLDDPGILNSTSILQLEKLPASLCIVGSGAIGVEFASLMGTLGVKVTLIEMLPRITPLMDETIGDMLARTLRRRDITIHTGTRVTSVTRTDAGYLVAMKSEKDGDLEIEAEKVLSAIGRAPNVEGLGLENVGIQPSRLGIQVDDRMRTVAPHIYAVGDCAAEGPMLAHVASYQGIVAVEDALGHTARADYSAVPYCIFSLPEAAGVGLTESQARAEGYDVQTGMFPMVAAGKAVAYGETEGFVKIVSETENNAVLGIHIMGAHASDLILEGTLLKHFEITLDEMEQVIHPHPTLGEAIDEALLAVRNRPLHIAPRRRR